MEGWGTQGGLKLMGRGCERSPGFNTSRFGSIGHAFYLKKKREETDPKRLWVGWFPRKTKFKKRLGALGLIGAENGYGLRQPEHPLVTYIKRDHGPEFRIVNQAGGKEGRIKRKSYVKRGK